MVVGKGLGQRHGDCILLDDVQSVAGRVSVKNSVSPTQRAGGSLRWQSKPELKHLQHWCSSVGLLRAWFVRITLGMTAPEMLTTIAEEYMSLQWLNFHESSFSTGNSTSCTASMARVL